VLRVQPDGSALRLGDVARVELGRDSYTTNIRSSGRTAAGMAIFPASGANALVTADAVKAKLDELAPFFPPGMKATVTFDTTPFVRVSIEGVVKTLIEAVVLVVAIMYLFMQNLRATLVPAIAVPVVLLGTMGVLAVAGFSINTLTMFGLVLAIGLLVDDAIVVVENVERLMREEGLSPRDATKRSMGEISGALVGIAVVLSAVFIPMAFFGGSTGVIYRQFSITVVSAMVLSVLVAMSLSPALCATLLKPVQKGRARGPWRAAGAAAGPLLRRLQPRLRPLHRALCRPGGLAVRAQQAQLCGVPVAHRRHRGAVPERCPRPSCPTRTRAACRSRCAWRRAPPPSGWKP
jgi:multidrug efflux pump subunit AcrB